MSTLVCPSIYLKLHFTDALLVHNDFHQTHGLFSLFDGLVVEDLDKPFEVSHTNGTAETNGVNGTKSAENVPLTNGDGSH